MRDLHARMLAALLDGDGLQGVAELASIEAGAPVAIVLPVRGLAAASDDSIDLDALTSAASERLAAGDDVELPGAQTTFSVCAGADEIGYAVALQGATNGLPHVEVDQEEVLKTAALAALTALAVSDARDEVAGELRGSLLEDLRSRSVDGAEIARRAVRMGCDLTWGAIALVTEVPSSRPRHAAAMITSEYQGALAEPLHGEAGAELTRVYALLPARGADGAATTLEGARRITQRLRSQGPAAFSSFCEDPAELGRAVAEAELMLDVIGRDERMATKLGSGVGDGVYRLLFRALASDPEEVRRFYAETVEPLVTHDREYRTDLLATLESYLGNDCNMNATARAVYAHRHTVAHRLNRIRELSGLDPSAGEDRERLGLGIKAFRIIEPTLPR